MNKIETWRKNAYLSRSQMSSLMKIPVRTIENWEREVNTPPEYVERLVINELKQITEKVIEKKAYGIMERLKSDEDGNRPEGKWAVVTSDGRNEWFYSFKNMTEAIEEAERMDGQPVYMICNKGKDNAYEDRDGNIVGEEFRLNI